MRDFRKPNPRIKGLADMVEAHFGVIQVLSPEEDRILEMIKSWFVGESSPEGALQVWSSTYGLRAFGKREGKPNAETQEPRQALDKVLACDPSENVLFVFLDLHAHMDHQPEIVRRVRDCARWLRGQRATMIMLASRAQLPADLEHDVATIEVALPRKTELDDLVDEAVRSFGNNPGRHRMEYSDELKEEILRALSGLTEDEAEDALAVAIIEAGGIHAPVVNSIYRAKQAAIKKTQCLEAVTVKEDMNSVGGLDVLKEWVIKRRMVFTDRAREFGIEFPKGLLTLGVPGGGKGLSARAVASAWRLPLLRLDMGAVFGGIVGESEGNLRDALKIAEAISPAVLWVDEIEKGLSGVQSSGSTDGGTAARVFGTFLTWLQEKSAPVVCYFTANDVRGLPPELLRKGRIDEIFFIDLPEPAERREIFQIHLAKRGRDVASFDLDRLVLESEGFVGAEIEQAVREGLIEAFALHRDLTTDDIATCLRRAVPLAKAHAEGIKAIRRIVTEGRAVRASRVATPLRVQEGGAR